jgi:hypothetical protein
MPGDAQSIQLKRSFSYSANTDHVADGPKADIQRGSHVRFVPQADITPLGGSRTVEPWSFPARAEANKICRPQSGIDRLQHSPSSWQPHRLL